MAVDAVMSVVGTGLGDAVVEFVYRVVLAHAGHIGADWHVGCEACNGIPVGGAMAVDAVMSMVGVGLGDAVVEAVLSGGAAIVAGGACRGLGLHSRSCPLIPKHVNSKGGKGTLDPHACNPRAIQHTTAPRETLLQGQPQDATAHKTQQRIN